MSTDKKIITISREFGSGGRLIGKSSVYLFMTSSFLTG